MLSIRKDVQMGLVIGAIVLSVVGVYVVLSAIAGAGAKQVAGAELVTDPNAGKLAASVTPVQPSNSGKTTTGNAGSGSTASRSTSGLTAPTTPTTPSNPVAPTTPAGTGAEVAAAEPSDPPPPTRSNDPWTNVDFNAPKVKLVSTGGNVSTPAGAPATQVEPGASTAGATLPAAPAAPGASQQYVIEPGDTFSSIAQKFYGDSKHFDVLVKANPAVNPGRMKPGVTIVVPPLPAKAAALADDRADVASAQLDPRTQYEVQPGDNLNKISLKLYGTSQKWNAIYQANKKLLGEDATKLKPGMILTLPETPTQGVR